MSASRTLLYLVIDMLYRKTIIRPEDGYFQDYTGSTRPAGINYKLHIILFVLTLITTTGSGAFLEGNNPFSGLTAFLSGLPFSLTLLSILGIHEFGHYFVARRWQVNVTPPYFIPVPLPPIGTFGAIIKMRSSIPSRNALVDIGAAGPIAGFIVSIAATIIGLNLSTVMPLDSGPSGGGYGLGESIIFKGLSIITLGTTGAEADIMLHPMAFAGWLGFFVTALNLIPFGQLDGGHILFAVSPRTHDLLRKLSTPLLLLLGITFWSGWLVWAVILFFLGSRHPLPDSFEPRLGLRRRITATLTLVIFMLCIMPMPIFVT
jgi:membrane-associated protease RseP (regulator of RpoE activity)